jgi:hypothetical protein
MNGSLGREDNRIILSSRNIFENLINVFEGHLCKNKHGKNLSAKKNWRMC